MPRKYDEDTKARAVRLVVDHGEDYASEWEAVKTVSTRLGMHPETLRKWLRQAEIDSGEVEGVSTTTTRELRELKRRNAELERASRPEVMVVRRTGSQSLPNGLFHLVGEALSLFLHQEVNILPRHRAAIDKLLLEGGREKDVERRHGLDDRKSIIVFPKSPGRSENQIGVDWYRLSPSCDLSNLVVHLGGTR